MQGREFCKRLLPAIMNDMNRRRFLQAASTALLLPFHEAFAASRTRQSHADYFFYDTRFGLDAARAETLSASAQIIGVQSDVTGIWKGVLSLACRQGPVVMRGVTTESFHFCLRTMLADSARVESRISRVGRDLHEWTIHSRPPNSTGIRT